MAANDSMYSVGPAMVGGSGAVNPGSAAYFGFQRELMRRQQQVAAAQAIDRQTAQDAVANKVALDNLETNKVLRESQAEEHAANTKKTNLAAAVTGLQPNDQIDPATAATLKANGGGGLMLTRPAVPAMIAGGPIADPTEADNAASPATEAQPESTVFRGTDVQQDKVKQEAAIQHILETAKPGSPAYEWAQFEQTGKTPPAGVVTPPKTAAETKAAHDIAMEKVEADMGQGKAIDPATAADYKVWKSRNSTDAEKRDAAAAAAAAGASRVDERTATNQGFQVAQQFRRELITNEQKIDADLERSDRALTLLNSPNFVTDAVAGPEFLQIVAGGMGSGLRMTDAELNRVNGAQSMIDQFKGKLAKWDTLDLTDKVTIQATMRQQMKDALDAVHAARKRKARLAADTLANLSTAADGGAKGLDALHAKYWEDRVDAAAMSNTGDGAAGSKTGGLFYNPATGKVEKR